jgi:hypothetical protein
MNPRIDGGFKIAMGDPVLVVILITSDALHPGIFMTTVLMDLVYVAFVRLSSIPAIAAVLAPDDEILLIRVALGANAFGVSDPGGYLEGIRYELF